MNHIYIWSHTQHTHTHLYINICIISTVWWMRKNKYNWGLPPCRWVGGYRQNIQNHEGWLEGKGQGWIYFLQPHLEALLQRNQTSSPHTSTTRAKSSSITLRDRHAGAFDSTNREEYISHGSFCVSLKMKQMMVMIIITITIIYDHDHDYCCHCILNDFIRMTMVIMIIIHVLWIYMSC